MKPLKLIMSAFGPFAEMTEIDFTKIGKCGVYLITGDTGSGKTTISTLFHLLFTERQAEDATEEA